MQILSFIRTISGSLFPCRNVLAATVFVFVFGCVPLLGQDSGTGVIVGRVLNPASGEYVRNAEIRIEGTDRIAVTNDDGSFRIGNVPPGETSLSISYTGYHTVRETLTVSAGATSVREIRLTSTSASPGAAIVSMEKFVVASAREGHAKAIMDQKQSMNITNTIASDVFGDIAEGNVGEFLKNIPGVDLELTQGETRNVRLRGLDSVYNAVTFDGVSLASTDANNRGGDARSFSFEQVSLNSIESIEVAKTVSADVDANAPAGSINLKSKRAFSREGRRIAFQANVTGFVDELKWGKSYGPTGGDTYHKLRPGGTLEYSDVFLDRKLGVVLSLAQSNLYSESARQTNTYNYATTATDRRPVVPTQITLTNVPRITKKNTVSMTTDFKASENLVLSLTGMYNSLSQLLQVRAVNFMAGARTAVLGDDPLTRLTSAPNGGVSVGTGAVGKLGLTYTLIPSFEYKRGSLVIAGKAAGSDSKSWYNPHEKFEMLRNVGSPAQSNIQFTAARSSPTSSDWAIQQVGGADFSTGRGFTSPQFQYNDGRATRAQVYSAELTAGFDTHVVVPVRWKTGVKYKEDIRDFRSVDQSRLYIYTGPGAGVGAWAPYNSPFPFVSDRVGASIRSSSGANVFYPDHVLIGRLFKERPDYFTHNMTAANYFTAFVDGFDHYEETIGAAFLMGTAQVKRTSIRVGLRWEDTETKAPQVNPLSADEVRRAGFPVTNGRATTIPGIDYQFLSRPRVTRKGSYDHLFPSASLKYNLRENLQFHLGYSRTVRRPAPSDMVGVVTINDVAGTISVPNPALKPEMSDNLSIRLAYYFEPVGLFAVNVYQNNVKGLHQSRQMTAAEYGYPGVGSDLSAIDLSNFLFTTTTSGDERIQVRGMEIEYSQSLSFLPWHFRHLTAHANYTRNYAQVVMPGMSPHGINAGLSYSYGRVNVYANVNWRGGETPVNAVGGGYTRYQDRRAPIDAGAAFKLTRRLSLFVHGRNVRSEPIVTMERVAPNPGIAQLTEVTGAVWTLGLKGVF